MCISCKGVRRVKTRVCSLWDYFMLLLLSARGAGVVCMWCRGPLHSVQGLPLHTVQGYAAKVLILGSGFSAGHSLLPS